MLVMMETFILLIIFLSKIYLAHLVDDTRVNFHIIRFSNDLADSKHDKIRSENIHSPR